MKMVDCIGPQQQRPHIHTSAFDRRGLRKFNLPCRDRVGCKGKGGRKRGGEEIARLQAEEAEVASMTPLCGDLRPAACRGALQPGPSSRNCTRCKLRMLARSSTLWHVILVAGAVAMWLLVSEWPSCAG